MQAAWHKYAVGDELRVSDLTHGRRSDYVEGVVKRIVQQGKNDVFVIRVTRKVVRGEEMIEFPAEMKVASDSPTNGIERLLKTRHH